MMAQRENPRTPINAVATEDRTDGGIVAEHASRSQLPLFVGPSTGGEVNTYRPSLFPIACWRLDTVRFDFDSSFIHPAAAEELKNLAELLANPDKVGARVSLFGHTDPVGDDDASKALAGRRAKAVYALLTRDTSLWEELFSKSVGADEWGLRSIQRMLQQLDFYGGPLDGTLSPEMQSGIFAFQGRNGLATDGRLGPDARAVLFKEYMDAICANVDGQPFSLKSGVFLAGGADSGGKGDYQGCGEFNPVMRFSQQQEISFANAAGNLERNLQNSSNRRVVAFVFRPGPAIQPDRWPCPKADEGVEGCKKRFWSDSDARRAAGTTTRHYAATQDTFACRFYQRIAGPSPCEATRSLPHLALVAGRLPSRCSIGKTFPKPSSIPMLRSIATRAAQDPSMQIVVVGHTDNTGAVAGNLALSLARAQAVSAFLTGDVDYFRKRFDIADPLLEWGWEEVQWMLSAVEIDGDPCYAGFVDGHASDMTQAALAAFQIDNELRATHTCNDKTLAKLIERYLEVLGAARPKPSQIFAHGAGSSIAPRAFGKGGQLLDGLEYKNDGFVGYRRVEIFLGPAPIQPSPALFEQNHAVYHTWCDAVVEELQGAQNFTLSVRLVDLYGSPLAQQAVDILDYSEGEETVVASLVTTRYGLITLTAPPGPYGLRFTIGNESQRADLFVHPDEVGGITIRLPEGRETILSRSPSGSNGFGV